MISLYGENELNNFLAKLNSFLESIKSLRRKLACRRLLFLTCGLLNLMVRFIVMCILRPCLHGTGLPWSRNPVRLVCGHI